MVKLFRIRGGVHPDYRKELTSEKPIVAMPPSELLYLPVQQHIGAPAEPVVGIGERVRKGQLVARAQGDVSAPIHAPTSGRVADIASLTAPHPSGLPQRTIVIESDGADEWAELPAPIDDPFAADARTLAARVAECGIVGLGGATFPSAVKLDLGARFRLDTLVINGAECEPYLTCDDRQMREFADEVVDGVRIIAHALGVQRVLFAIESNKPRALEAMTVAAAPHGDVVRVVAIPTRYPMGSERHLVQALTGRETPARKITADIGVVVHNVGTARAIHHAVRFGRPLISRVVTVSGHAVREPKNVEVRLGTPVSRLLDFCGGLAEEPDCLLSGGPMMGQPLPLPEVATVKGTSGILALTREERHAAPASPCIRCGTCVSVCPCGLVPVEMAAYVRKENLDAAARAGVMDCLSCGSCAFACPSHIPLVQYFNYAKGRLNAIQRDRLKQDRIKRLVEAKQARLEKIAAAKKAAIAARKAAAQAKAADDGSDRKVEA